MTRYYQTEAAPHLGGYMIGGDEATFYPDLWRWLVEERGVRSMIDVGCGEGRALEFFTGLGCVAQGVDGIAQPDPWIIEHDFAAGPWAPALKVPWDLVWCCEFVEHVDEQHADNFLDTFALAPLVLLTHAEPGQAGHHHVNCQPATYWVARMAEHGFALDERLTVRTRELAALNPNPWNHFRRSGLAFTR